MEDTSIGWYVGWCVPALHTTQFLREMLIIYFSIQKKSCIVVYKEKEKHRSLKRCVHYGNRSEAACTAAGKRLNRAAGWGFFSDQHMGQTLCNQPTGEFPPSFSFLPSFSSAFKAPGELEFVRCLLYHPSNPNTGNRAEQIKRPRLTSTFPICFTLCAACAESECKSSCLL